MGIMVFGGRRKSLSSPSPHKRIPALHGGFENLWIHIDLPGDILNIITFPDPALVDLC